MKKISLLAATMLAGLTLMPAVVFARQGEAVDTSAVMEDARSKAQEKRKTKEARVAEIKEEVAARKLAVKQDVCEKQAAKLTEKMPKLSNSANRIKTVIDKHYERVQGFYESGQLTVTNYDELVANIELAKANAETSLQAVNEYEFEVDCESETVASELDSFRTALNDAKEDLKTYRKELVALISSLKSANAAANQDDGSSEEAGDGTETETETETESENNTGGETQQ